MRNDDIHKAILGFAGLGLIVLLVFGWDWYRAGVQQRIYSRQGIQMSQWEVFMGGEPAERVIQVK